MKLVSSAIIAVIALVTLPVNAQDLTGSYKCTGEDPFSKSQYEMDLRIAKTGDTYNLRWEAGGSKPFSGTGFISKDVNNVLGAEFWNPTHPDNSGVIIYQIQPDGTLAGSWAIADQALIGTETCKKQ